MAPEIPEVVDHLFRHESGKMVATLTRIFGIEHLQLSEDVVQEALLKAMQSWPYAGVPRNPSAWILQAARNRALDLVRRERNFRSKQQERVAFLEQDSSGTERFPALFGENEIRDDPLRLIFACCHPVLSRESQVALTLKTLCGFSESEIAAAYLTSEAAIAKRLVRARQRIRDAKVRFEIPAGEELSNRLDAVLQTLYLVFNEGYKASWGKELVRRELCDEAIRLTELLLEHPAGNLPKVHAALALMLLSGARLSTRVDPDGNLLLLAEQGRSCWDKAMIQKGLVHLDQSAAGEEISEFHLQAGLACCHGTAGTYAATDWARILSLYDLLIEINATPVVALNRAVAVSKVHGPRAGLKAVEEIPERDTLDSYYRLHAVVAQLHYELGGYAEAGDCFQRALELTSVESEHHFLTRRLKVCEARRTP